VAPPIFPTLSCADRRRSSAPGSTRWDGFYVGGQAGGAWSGTDFSNSTQSLVAFILRNTTDRTRKQRLEMDALGKYDANGMSLRRVRRLSDAVGQRGHRRRGELQSHQCGDGVGRLDAPPFRDLGRLTTT